MEFQENIISFKIVEVPNINNKLSVLSPASVGERDKIINNLDNNAGLGIDGINTKILKCVWSMN